MSYALIDGKSVWVSRRFFISGSVQPK